MALIRWEPVTELNTIQNEMNRLFNTFFDQPAPPAAAAHRQAVDPCDGPRRDHRPLRSPRRPSRPVRRRRQRPARGQRAHHLRRAQNPTRTTRRGLLPNRARVRQLRPLPNPPRRRRPRRRASPFRPRRARDPNPQTRTEKAPTGPDRPRHPPNRRHQDIESTYTADPQVNSGDPVPAPA